MGTALDADYVTSETPFTSKREHFNVRFYILLFFLPHLISILPPLYSGVMCNTDFGERCTCSNQTPDLPQVWLSLCQLSNM